MQNIKSDIENKLKTIVSDMGIMDITPVLERPNDEDHGDYATNIAMQLAKKLGKSPRDIATEISTKFDSQELVEKVEVAGPGFINFYVNKKIFKNLVQEINAADYGKSDWGKGKRWLIEHTSANPNKSMHLGHLRTNLTGMAVSNLFEAVGIDVIRDYVDNNRGIAIAKLMWGYLKFAKKDGQQITDINYWYEHQNEWKTPEDENVRPDKFVDELYVKASEDFKSNSGVEEQVRKLVIDWENEDKKNWALWEKVLEYSHKGQELTMKRLGSKVDKYWHEHEHYQKGKDIVDEGLKKRIFKKLEDGAIITNLKAYKIPDTIVIKKDGTSLYITQDLALTKLKVDTFHPDKLFWTVGPEQSLALKQVFAICEQLGIGKNENFVHLSFGFMTIKGFGKMSSRTGNVTYIDELIDDIKAIIKEKIVKEDIDEVEKDRIAEKVGIASLKYSSLKVGRLTNTAFDFETSLSFDGDSGPYLMYTYARAKSILRQAGEFDKEIVLENVLNNLYEIKLLKHLGRFPELVLSAALNYAPNFVAEYLFELAQKFNQFYTNCSVLNAENEQDKIARLKLVSVTAQVLKNGLGLLGIETVERM